MSCFLFASQPGTGHLNPLLTIAQRLRTRGHETVFVHAGPARFGATITAHGFRAIGLRPPLSTLGLALLPLASGSFETRMALRLFTAQVQTLARRIVPVIRRTGAATVVADFALPGAHVAAEAAGVPFVTIYHAGLAYRGPGVPPLGSGLPIGTPSDGAAAPHRARMDRLLAGATERVVRARAAFGLPARNPGHYFWTSPWATLVLTAEGVEAPRDPLPPRTFYIGPCLSGRDGGGDAFPFDRLSPMLPKVYVSLGTVFNNKPDVYRRIIDAFADGTRQVVVSAGGAYARLRRGSFPPSVLLFQRVPQVQLLPRVDAVISHGGNNTVNETLAAGRPLLVLPVGGEQGDNAARVVWLGAGLRGDIRAFTSDEVRAKVDRLLTEPGFSQRAAEVARVLAETDGVGTATAFLEHLAVERRPVERPEGSPLTLTRNAALPWSQLT